MNAGRYTYFLFCLLACTIILTGCGENTEEKVIRLGHGLSPSHPVHKGMERFKKMVEEKTNDRIEIKIYPSEQLGSEREMIEMLQIGSLGMSKVSSAVLEGFVPLYKVLGMPYIFKSREHRFTALNTWIGDTLKVAPTKYGLRALGFYDAGSRSFYTKDTPIREPSDLKGLKVRVMESQTAIKMVEALGGSPTPIAWGELYSALQQGIVNAAENNPPTFRLANHYQVCNYYSLDKHASIPDVVLISEHLWQKLSSRERQILQNAFNESVQYQKKLWKQATEEALQKVKEAGVEIIRPDLKPFREMVKPVYESFKDQPRIYKLIQEIQHIGDTLNTRSNEAK